MLKSIPKSAKRLIGTLSVVIIVLNLSIQPKDSQAMVFKGNETDILAMDILSPICDVNADQHARDVSVSDDRKYGMAWQDDSCDGPGNGTGIYVELYDKVNGPNPATNGPIRVNQTLSGDQKNPSMAMDHSGNFVIAWEGSGTGDTDGIYVRAFNSDGTPRGDEVLVNTHTNGVQDSPKVAIDFDANPIGGQDNRFVVVWHGEGENDTDGVFMQTYNLVTSGNISAVGSNIQVNTYTTGNQKDPDVAMNNFDEIMVTWSGPGQGYTSSSEIWMQGYDSDNSTWEATANNIRVNSTSPATKPAIASNKSTEPETHNVPGGHFIIVYKAGEYNEVDAKLINRCSHSAPFCSLGNVELNITKVPSDLPDVAMDYLGNFTVAWQQDDTAEGQNVNIHAINYNYLGHRIDNAFRVNQDVYSDGSQDQTKPVVAKDKDGEYYILWTSPHTTRGLDARYRSFGTDIFKSGAEKLANTASSFYENSASAAISPNGIHAITFVGQDSVSGQSRIYYSLYNSNGNAIALNQPADTVDDSSVHSPSIAFFKDTEGSGVGRFIIVWTGNDPGSNPGQHVLYREIDASGTPATNSENVIDTITANTTYDEPRVSAGYYNDNTSSVIDRFAVIYQISSDSSTTGVETAYHTQNGFSRNTLESMSGACFAYCTGTGVDLYANINGNDQIIYTWDALDADQNGIYAQEANGGTLSGSKFAVNTNTTSSQVRPDAAFVSPTEYVISWTSCNNNDCISPSIYASRYAGNFNNGSPSVIDNNFIVYPGGGADIIGNYLSRIAADPVNHSFIIVWYKTIHGPSPRYEITGKLFKTTTDLENFGVGFMINSTITGGPRLPDVDMNGSGEIIVSWEGAFAPSGTTSDAYGAIFQMLDNPTYIQATPELPTSAQLSITNGGKTLAIPSNIQFPSITASTNTTTNVELEIDENPAQDQPLYFQLEDLGGNSTNCTLGPCYSVSINASDFTYMDAQTGQTYTIPSSNVFIKNYDENHPDVRASGLCESSESSESFEALFGNGADFALDSSTCDYASLDSTRTLINKISNMSDTAQIRLYPKLKLSIPALTPPGTYTGTITITSA